MVTSDDGIYTRNREPSSVVTMGEAAEVLVTLVRLPKDLATSRSFSYSWKRNTFGQVFDVQMYER